MPDAVLAIIPARWGATRFPGKPLHPIAGKPLVRHVWERARRATRLTAGVCIATDDARIAAAAAGFGARVVLTRSGHPSGTDRVAEAAAILAAGGVAFSHVLNVQGDEPLIAPALLDGLADALLADPTLPMVTAACPLRDADAASDLLDPNCVKVVLARNGDALYFSRAAIPHPAAPGATAAGAVPFYRHQGVYGYRRDFLETFVRWEPSWLERAERLEQLRALENGARIQVIVTEQTSLGVDVPEDVPRVEASLRNPVFTG